MNTQRKDLSPQGRDHTQRMPLLLLKVDQACSEILSSEFSELVQVCLGKADQAGIQPNMGFQADLEPSRKVGKEPI